ncbi:helix-turn-helix domain-containing protein [Pelagovum pacificum]|uniref:Helix-turn-helix transcriptional regulator n=1 Tax=Pelagovum pacificum TaxID=2588711 RepID=A0A5C5GDC7_9RHOB|nr:helix-turn-helix transcriptional regulator [Pelagovum pacificum]QQA44069.1 helix-turn-helix transcriptional regulator [Pelagovum pacificum]TNY32802.1 helix-turn-helix transcriptional regulator [Pelagovum pacificum]
MDEGTESGWYSDESATFGDRLAAARDAAGMSQKDLAKRLGVKLSTLRNWEDDLAEPRANKLSMVSGLLSVSLPWLLTGEGDGLDGPVSELPEDVSAILSEMRSLRTQSSRIADRLGILEKRLRQAVTEG